ncbi:MAG: aspartate ammonia-lyase [Flavobacteriaceae bacterium]
MSNKTRIEHDLIGDKAVPANAYYGVQTLRATENFKISRSYLYHFPELIYAFAQVKEAAALTNKDLGILEPKIANAIVEACKQVKTGKYNNQFVVDMMQGGAGTSTNMNANEVIANVALELLGHKKGEYKFCHPNNHVNLSQSTNDAYPTALRIGLYRSITVLEESLKDLIKSFRKKGKEFSEVIKMGRTQLQDAVPMTLGQEFEAFAVNLSEEINRLKQNKKLLLEVNMGATAIGTGINADPEFTPRCVKHLAQITDLEIKAASNLIEATSDTGVFIMNSSAIKRLAIKLSKISSDLRLLSSGPRTGLNEINLPPMQPGSSIMPGKVNPVIPEVVNQIAFRVIGNDLAVTLGSEAGQLQLNVMEPVIAYSLLENVEILNNGMNTLNDKCIKGITANADNCKAMVLNSIGLVTALNPYLGYEVSTDLAAKALKTGKGVYELVLEEGLMDEEKLNDILRPENMIKPRKFGK